MKKHNYTMLVVDDEEISRRYVLDQIEWHRLEISTLYEAGNGQEALELIHAKKPDLMILDIRMPGMDGTQLLEEICREKIEISVVCLSGYSDFEAARKMLSSGRVVEYLLKPASADALFEAVTRCLTRIKERELLRGQTIRQVPPESEKPSAEPNCPTLGGGRKKAVVQEAKDYIAAHYMEKLSLDMVASHVYLNPSYFSRIFTEVEGISFIDYLQQVRVQQAKRLLVDPRYKVYEVADLVGYPNFKHFLKVFKKFEQKTPSQYRETAGWLFFSNEKK